MGRGRALPIDPPRTTVLGEPRTSKDFGFLSTSSNGLTRGGSSIDDAYLSIRPGLTKLGNALNQTSLGSISFRDDTDQNRIIVGTPSTWWSYNDGNLTWSDLAAGLTGAVTMPVIFAHFQVGATRQVIGVNDSDTPRSFVPSATATTTLSSAPIARSVTVISNRVVFLRTNESAVKYTSRARWSSAGDATTYPSGAFNDLGDTPDQGVAILNLGRTAGVAYKDDSQWMVQSVPGASDANAFSFFPFDYQPGPMGSAAVTYGPGQTHVYLGQDGNLYSCDGVQASVLANLQRAIMGTGNLNFATRTLTRVAYYKQEQEVWILVPLGTDTVPLHGFVFSYKTGGFWPMTFGQALSMLGTYFSEVDTVIQSLTGTIQALPAIPINQLGRTSLGTFLLAGSASKVYQVSGATDDGTAISGNWEWIVPIPDGEEAEFDAVLCQFKKTGTSVLVTVSVKVGPTFDALTETTLGTLDTSTDVTIIPNSSNVRPDARLRGRVVVVRLQVTTSVALQLRKLALRGWERREAVDLESTQL